MIFLLAIHTHDRNERLVAVASTSAEALAKGRAARPDAPQDTFRIVGQSSDDVLLIPKRGRPPSERRLAAERTWQPFAESSTDGRDIA
jgi:hypothetical protein